MRKSRNPLIATCEYMLWHEKEIRACVYQAKHSGGGTGGSKLYADPTASEAIRNVTPVLSVKLRDGREIDSPETWLEVIDLTYSYHGGELARVLEERYRMRKSFTLITQDHHVSGETLYRYINKARTWMTMAAIQMGLLKIV